MEKIKTDGKEMIRAYSAMDPRIDAVIFVNSNDAAMAKRKIIEAINDYCLIENAWYACYGNLIEDSLEDISHESIYHSSSEDEDARYEKQLDIYYKESKLKTHYIEI